MTDTNVDGYTKGSQYHDGKSHLDDQGVEKNETQVGTGTGHGTPRHKKGFGPGHPEWYKDSWATYQPKKHDEADNEEAGPGLGTIMMSKTLQLLGLENKFGKFIGGSKSLDALDLAVPQAAMKKGKAKTSAKSLDLAVSKKSEEQFKKSILNSIKKIKQDITGEVTGEVGETGEGEVTGEVAQSIEGAVKQNDDLLTRNILDVTQKLEDALSQEPLKWKEIDLLIRQLAILLVQKMANNDNRTIQEELKLMEQDIKNVEKTFNTKWELAIGITVGLLSIGGGLVGVGGGIAGVTGAVSSGTMQTLKTLTDGANMIGQGGSQAQKFVENDSQKKRQRFQYELERDRGHKSTAESSQQNVRSLKGSQMSQANAAIEAAYRAFIALAS